ncbi:MAG: type VI secretion system baseplate subunit TssG [Lewinellaceae bacterium]|nr:type VI secretion system baseplate subunit TssG [Saprospiraceae bacterium]MCB9339185.1 type VI secretion system baseplate subunit TssG [Lewinellaceae bacterium]
MSIYKNIPAGLTFDMKVEALAAAIMDCDPERFKSVEQFLVKPVGHLTRSMNKEVLSVVETPHHEDDVTNLILEVNREGLFDILPASLFLHPDEPYEDDVEKAEQLAKQTEDARQFFLPFEEIFYQARIAIECHEKKVMHHPEIFLRRILEEAGDAKESASPDEDLTAHRRALMLFTPLLDQLVGNAEQCRMVLEKIFRKKVAMTTEAPAPIPIPLSLQTVVGEDAVLGENTLIGDCFLDGIPSTKLEIKEDHLDKIEAWLPGQYLRQFAEKNVLPLFFSSEIPVELQVSPVEPTGGFVLDDQQPTSILGYVTYI